MATFSKPLISAAALASAAAVAVATPAIMPSVSAPTPSALSRAAYELTTFSDLLSIPTVVWTDVLFGNDSWGGTLSSTTYGPAWAEPTDALGQPAYVNPWAAYCNGRCDSSGIPGVLYMATDALINGNGNGYDDYENWPVGLVNYFWEPATAALLGSGNSPRVQFTNNGFSSSTWYVLAGLVNEVAPELQVPLAAAFWGPNNVAVFYNLGLTIAAALVSQVPVVGPVTANTILAYLGDLEIPDSGGSFYQYGLSGALNYWVDLATGAVPFPGAAVAAGASVAAPAASVAVDEPSVSVADEAPVAEVTNDNGPAAEVKVDDTPVAEVTNNDAPVADVKVDDAPVADVTVDDVKVDEAVADEVAADVKADDAPAKESADSAGADEAKQDSPAAADSSDSSKGSDSGADSNSADDAS